MTPQQYCLRWKHHHTNVQNMFAQLLEKERFCDVTLYCSPSFASQLPEKEPVDSRHIRGVSIRAHRVVLAACSELLGSLLNAHEGHTLGEPVLVIDGAEPRHLRALLDYMYTGEMNVHHSQLASLLKTAEELRIKGLTDIRWNNKDEPPDSEVVTAVATNDKKQETKPPEKEKPQILKHPSPKLASPKLASPKLASPKLASPKLASPKNPSPKHISPKPTSPKDASPCPISPNYFSDPLPVIESVKTEIENMDLGETTVRDRVSVNGGPPPLIKLPTKEKISPTKRDQSDSESPSPKRPKLRKEPENDDDDESIPEKDLEWQHGNLDITAERVVGWGGSGTNWSRENSDEEWADNPADIGSFLHTKLRVDGDNTADEESNDSISAAASSSTSADRDGAKLDATLAHTQNKPSVGFASKAAPTESWYSDVVKLSDYLLHGRRPQFWEENYVKRVMEAVRMKELEMKQAAEILGVSYGTLYGRYRDVYGCINRPYRTARDFWQAKGPSEVLEQLQRGEITMESASLALGVGVANLAAFMSSDIAVEKGRTEETMMDPIPIEVDPVLRARRYAPSSGLTTKNKKPSAPTDKAATNQKVTVASLIDGEIPATVISTGEGQSTAGSGKWPQIRVASLDTLRPSASPSALMRSRPDLTIVAAKRSADEH